MIPGAQLLLIDNASHFAHWQQVEAVNSALLEFSRRRVTEGDELMEAAWTAKHSVPLDPGAAMSPVERQSASHIPSSTLPPGKSRAPWHAVTRIKKQGKCRRP